MNLYRFLQNNSGGWLSDDMPHVLYVEAETSDAANDRAVAAGVYFDGVDMGMDCECCGDRWYRVHREDECVDVQTWYESVAILRAGACELEYVVAPTKKKE